jgi:hypothetical protein
LGRNGDLKLEKGKAKSEEKARTEGLCHKEQKEHGSKDPPLQAREKKPGEVRKGQECVT